MSKKYVNNDLLTKPEQIIFSSDEDTMDELLEHLNLIDKLMQFELFHNISPENISIH